MSEEVHISEWQWERIMEAASVNQALLEEIAQNTCQKTPGLHPAKNPMPGGFSLDQFAPSASPELAAALPMDHIGEPTGMVCPRCEEHDRVDDELIHAARETGWHLIHGTIQDWIRKQGARVQELESSVRNLKGAMQADDERLEAAAQRVDMPGCCSDTPDDMAEIILELRARLAVYEQAGEELPDEQSDCECCKHHAYAHQLRTIAASLKVGNANLISERDAAIAERDRLREELEKSEQSCLQVIDERDSYHDKADELTQAISDHLGIDFGEHSSANCPWDNAIEGLNEQATILELVNQRATARQEGAREERERIIAQMADPDNPFDWNLDEDALRDWMLGGEK